jgi:hypothetical protein
LLARETGGYSCNAFALFSRALGVRNSGPMDVVYLTIAAVLVIAAANAWFLRN